MEVLLNRFGFIGFTKEGEIKVCDIKKIIKNIISIIVFNFWLSFLWGSDIIIFDQVLEKEYYFLTWPITIIIHVITIIGYLIISKWKGINKNIFVSCIGMYNLAFLIFCLIMISDGRFEYGLSEYITFLIASIVPVFIVIISIIILIKSILHKKKSIYFSHKK